jgi:Golgi-resident PAP phosphatase
MKEMNLGGSIKINKCAVFSIIGLVVLLIYILSSGGNGNELKELKENQSKVNLRKLLIGLILASKQGGKEVIKISTKDDFQKKSKGKTKEGVDDPVTLADMNSHCRIANGLMRIFPQLNLISEEEVEKKNCPDDDEFFDLDPSVLSSVSLPDENVALNDVAIWIDPLDATKEFTESLFHYVSVMICVAVKGEPIIGVLHFPFSQKTYWGWKGKGVSESLVNVRKVSRNRES